MTPFVDRPMFRWAIRAGFRPQMFSRLASAKSYCAIAVRVRYRSGCFCLGFCSVCDPFTSYCWSWLVSAVKPRTWSVMYGSASPSGEGLSFACKARSPLGQRIMRVFHELLSPIRWYRLCELPSNQYELSKLRKAIKNYCWFAGRAAIRAIPALMHSSLRIVQDYQV